MSAKIELMAGERQAREPGGSRVVLMAEEEHSPSIPAQDVPFRIALLGDFSGRANRNICEIGPKLVKRKPVRIDCDDFDDVLAKLHPQLRLSMGNDEPPLTVGFSSLDDFHPDNLFASLDLFTRIRNIRSKLANSATFAAAAAELGITSKTPASVQSAPARVADYVAPLASGSLLEATVEQTEARRGELPERRIPDELEEFVRRATEPHKMPAPNPRQGEILDLVDRTITSLMRALLHAPDLQALESAWRAAFLLVRRVETSPQLQLHIVDVSKAELAADLASSQDPRSTGLHQLLVQQSLEVLGGEPWAVLAGNYTFDASREDTELLGRMAKVAHAAGAPFLAAASPRIIGCESLEATPDAAQWRPLAAPNAAAWASLRSMPESVSVGLALPRFLLRLPYGKKTDSVESFDFEEMLPEPAHEDYLWANPAFACALLLAQGFSQDGWDMSPGVVRDIDDLPLHAYTRDGQSELKPCAEVLLTEQAAERILENGLMPLVSFKAQDKARLLRFQSIATPLSALAGRWAG